MGKVKDDVSGQKPAKAPSKGGRPESERHGKHNLPQFFLNLLKPDLYKPMQGWHARVYTGPRAGVIVPPASIGFMRSLTVHAAWRFGVPRLRGALLGG